MNYRELQKALKCYKNKGLTDIPLNSKKTVLLAELNRIQAHESVIEKMDATVKPQAISTPQNDCDSRSQITQEEFDREADDIHECRDDQQPESAPIPHDLSYTDTFVPRYQNKRSHGLIVLIISFVIAIARLIIRDVKRFIIQPVVQLISVSDREQSPPTMRDYADAFN